MYDKRDMTIQLYAPNNIWTSTHCRTTMHAWKCF